jgi:hypothetical protein
MLPDGPGLDVAANQWQTLKSVPGGIGVVYSHFCPGQ